MSTRKYNLARAHNISLPSTKRKLNIDEATSSLSSMGYRMGGVRHSLADKTSYWSVTTPTGSVVEVAANKLTDFVYGKIKNLNAQRYTDELIRSLLPFEQEQIRNEGYKVYEVEICMPKSGCNHYETVAAKDSRDAVRIGKAHAKGMKFNGVTKVNAKELHMKSINKRLSSMVINELNHALEMAESDGEQGIAREVRAVLASPTVETLKAHPLAIKEIKYKLEIALDNPEDRNRVRAYENLLKSVSNRMAKSTCASAKLDDYYNNPAAASKRVNNFLPRIVAAIKAAGGQVDSVEKHDSKSSASIRFPTKGDYQVSVDIGSTYLAVNRYVIKGAGVLHSVHLFNGELSDIDKAVAIAVNEWKKIKAARQHFSRVGARSRFAVRHPSVSGTPIDPYATKVPILLNDKTTVTAVRNDGRWSIEGRPDMPTSRKFEQLIAELNAAGFSRVGAKGMNSKNLDPNHPNNFVSLFREKYLDDINKLLEDINQPKIFLPNYTSRSQIRNDLDDLMESATDAGISIPRRIEEAYESARLGHFSRVGAKVKNTFRNFEDPSVMLSELERQLQYPKSSDKEWQFPALLKTIEKLAKSDNIHPNSDFWNRLRAANAEVKRLSYSRVGAKAKFGEVENLLNMISDQMNSGNNDLAKTNLRKLAAKIGEIRHTRSEWDQFMTVAKSLGFTESQIGGFSRRGSKMAKSTYATRSTLQNLANKVQGLNDQYHLLAARAEQAKSAADIAYRAYDEAKKILDDAIRSSIRSRQNSRGFSRVGAKAKFDQTETINKILTWYQKLIKMEKRELVDLYDQKMQRGRVESKSDIREMQKPWMAVDIIRTQFRENEVQAAFNASPSGKPLRHARVGAKATHAASVNDPRSISDTDTQIDWLLTEAESAMRHINEGSQRNLIVRQQIKEIPSLMRSNTNPRLIVRLKALKQAVGISTSSRTGVKATHAQVNIESGGVGSYYNAHLKDPRGTGSWAFIAPDGSIVRVPGTMSLSAAKSWLKQNATISGYYKVAP